MRAPAESAGALMFSGSAEVEFVADGMSGASEWTTEQYFSSDRSMARRTFASLSDVAPHAEPEPEA